MPQLTGNDTGSKEKGGLGTSLLIEYFVGNPPNETEREFWISVNRLLTHERREMFPNKISMKIYRFLRHARFALVTAIVILLFAAPLFKPQNAQASAARLYAMERVTGLHERKNKKTIQNMVGINPSTTPWCGAATAYAVRKAGGTPPKYPNKAINWMKFGKAVSLKKARKGDIVIFRFNQGYHVAVFKKHSDKGRVEVCGGNMSDKFMCSSYNASGVKAVRH